MKREISGHPWLWSPTLITHTHTHTHTHICCWWLFDQWIQALQHWWNITAASLQKGKTIHPNECSGYDTKQSDDEAPVMLELWGMRGTPSLPLLPDPFWPGEVASDRVLSMGKIELFKLDSNTWNHLTVYKKELNKMFTNLVFNIYIYKQDLVLNNQWLICHKTEWKQTDERSMWSAKRTRSKNRLRLVTFNESILVSLWTFQLILIYIMFIKRIDMLHH